MAKINEWMSVSDLMTGLMIIFLFIAVAYMSRVRKDISEYADTKKELYEKINDNFRKEQETDNKLHVSKDLSMRFLKASTLFPQGKSELTDSFKITLNEVMPKYLDILANLDSAQTAMVKEIRIEGHTDTDGTFLHNMTLSSARAFAVYKYIHDNCSLNNEERKFVEDYMISVGYSYAKTVKDEFGKENKDKSRH